MRRNPSHFYLKINGAEMKILILRFSSMGDILLATPVLDAIKKNHPDSQIDWVVNKKFEETLRSNPLISKVLSFSDRQGLRSVKKEIDSVRYDIIFDLHKNYKTYYLSAFKKNVFRYNKRVFDRFMLVHFKRKYKVIPATEMYFAALEEACIETLSDWRLSFYLNEATEAETVKKYGLKDSRYIVFVPGASYYTKMWPKECFKELAEKILQGEMKRKIIVLGKGMQEEAIGNFICGGNSENCVDLTGKLNLNETAAVLKYAEIVVTNDNGPMHLAECFKKKIIAIFGCTTEEFGFFPYSSDHVIIESKDLECRPCTHYGKKKCPEGHFKCMKNITPESVYKAIGDFTE